MKIEIQDIDNIDESKLEVIIEDLKRLIPQTTTSLFALIAYIAALQIKKDEVRP